MACNTFPGIWDYTRFDAISGTAVLEKAPLPKDVIALGVNGIRKIWHDKKMRGRGVTEDRQRPWLKLRTTVLDLAEGLERKVNYICCLRSIAYGLHS